MAPLIDPALLEEKPHRTLTFLRSTPDGFEDRSEGDTCTELVAQLIEASPYVKLYEGTHFVHASDECDNDPSCPLCNDPKARHYVRLRLKKAERLYQIDTPPNARRRFAKLAKEVLASGSDHPMIRLTCTRKERDGLVWGQIGFEVAKEAA